MPKDPLVVLRQFHQSGEEVKVVKDKIIFGKHRYNINTPTPFGVTLLDAWVISKFDLNNFAGYRKLATEHGVKKVAERAERKLVIDYLEAKEGEILEPVKTILFPKNQFISILIFFMGENESSWKQK